MDNQDYVIDNVLDMAFSSTKAALDWYRKQYYIALEQNEMLEKECAALRSQINEVSN